MVNFLIIRHGYSKSNESGYFTGQRDVELSELGKEQAEQTAKYIFENFNVDAVYSSPLKRAYETAIPISNLFRVPIYIHDGLKEIYGGLWEEKTPEQILKLYRKDYLLWLNDIGLAHCTGGESMAEVQYRAILALKEIAEINEEKTVAITTHAGVIRTLECAWKNLPLSEMKDVNWVKNCSISLLRYENGEFITNEIGSISHLTTKITSLPQKM